VGVVSRPDTYPQRTCSTCGLVLAACNLPRHERTHGDPRERLRVPPEDQALIVETYRRGLSLKRTSEATFWSQTVVRDVLLANDVQLRPPGTGRPRSPQHITTEERLKRAQLYGRGLSLKEVAEACGVTYEAVRQTLVGLDVPRRDKTNLRWARARRERAAAERTS
jgi:hypothetical protein